MANYFQIPETSQIVYEGDTVILSEKPGYLYTATYGWHTAKGVKEKGWYFVGVNCSELIAIDNVYLPGLTVVKSKGGSAPRPPYPGPSPHPHPHPQPGPRPEPIPPVPGILESRAAVTVEDIAQRNVLASSNLPEGKIVRVNNDGTGKVAYFEWDAEAFTWVPLNWGSGSVTSIDAFDDDLLITSGEVGTVEPSDSTIVTSLAAGRLAIDAAHKAIDDVFEWEDLD